jgi:putative ABC transport system permease protein
VAAPVRPALLVLASVVGVLLLVTCANVAGLVLVRAAGREREMALRASLGAGRARMLTHLLMEGLLLAVAGGALGLGLAVEATRAVASLEVPAIPRLADLTVDGSVLLFTLAVSGLAGVVLGLTPLVAASRRDLSTGLREGGGGGTGGRVRRVRRVLVGAELAASTALLVGAALLFRSLVNLAAVETGVQVQDVAVLQVSPPRAARPTASTRSELRRFYQEVRARVSRLPDVRSVGGVTIPPFTANRMYEMTRPGRPAPEPGQETLAQLRSIEPGYFESLGIPLTRGRALDDRDGGDATPVAVVDEEMALRFFAGEDPIGKSMTVHWDAAEAPTVSYEVVGVVGSVRQLGPASPPQPTLYVPRAHETIPYWENFALWLTIRTTGDRATTTREAAQAVWDVDATVPVTRLGTLEELLNRHTTGTRQQTLLTGCFALLATLLALVGIVGVVTYAVAQRGHELGIRQALGAGAREVVGLVMAESVRLIVVGVGAGLVLAAAGSRVLATLLFGVGAADPVTYLGVAAGLIVVALIAAWLPARRAAAVRPAVALRGRA